MSGWHDWDCTVSCKAESIEHPATEEEIVEIVQSARQAGRTVRAFGAGHSWSPLVPTDGTLVNLDNLAEPLDVDTITGKATVQAGIRLRDVGPWLQDNGLTMRNLGAITPQSVAGAIGSGTHGTGMAFGVLGTQISAVRVVDGRGDLRDYNVDDHPREMSALRLSLGSLGIIVRATIDCVSDHSVKLKKIPMSFGDFLTNLVGLYTGNERVRAYWFPGSDRVYVHTMNRTDEPSKPGSIFPWKEAVLERQIVMGALWGLGRRVNGLVPWCNRIQESVGFKAGSAVGRCFDAITTPIPPFHQEAEVAVPLEHAGKAIMEYGGLVTRNGLQVNVPSEIRFSRADDVLLSPAYGRDVCYIGGYNALYRSGDTFFEDFCLDLESRYDARRHWGKVGAPNRVTARRTFPGFAEFETIRREFDPDAMFANEYIRELFAL